MPDAIVFRGSQLPRGVDLRIHATETARDRAIDDEAERAWADLSFDNKPLLDSNRMNEFPAQYDAALRAFEPTARRMAVVHSTWLRCNQLAQWMHGVHDDEEIRSGYAYRESLAQCIGNGVKNSECKELLMAWLSSESAKDVSNLLGRALLFNQAQLVSAAEPHLKANEVPLDGILNVYKKAMETVSKPEQQRLIDRLTLNIANVLVDAVCTSKLSQVAFLVSRNMVLIGLSLLSSTAIRPSKMTSDELAEWLLKQVIATKTPLKQSDLQARLAAHGSAKAALKHRGKTQSPLVLEIDLKQLQIEGVISEHALRPARVPFVEDAKAWLGSASAAEFRLGVATVIVQMIALCFALIDLSESDRFNSDEAQLKAVTSSISLLAAITECVATTAEKNAAHPLSLYLLDHWRVPVESMNKYGTRARVAGAIAGALVAVFDFIKAYRAHHEGQAKLRNAFIFSGALGSISAIYSLIGTAIWPVLIITLIWAFTMPYVNGALLQSWIRRSYFGTGKEKFSSIDEELKSFNSAVGG